MNVTQKVDDLQRLRDRIRGCRFSEDEAHQLLTEIRVLQTQIHSQTRLLTDSERITNLEERVRLLAEEIR